jgi:hypothetical protein
MVELSSSVLNKDIEMAETIPKKKDKFSKHSSQIASTRRRATVATGNGDELEDLLDSSASESSYVGGLLNSFSDVSDSDNEKDGQSFSKLRQPTFAKARSSKSMGVSDSTHLKEHQVQQLVPQQQSTRRSSTSARPISRPSIDRKQNSFSSAGVGSSGASTAPIVQGMSESESWAAQIEQLREDNDAEHELFGDQVAQKEQEYYDMRIKVIVRKRPLSKSETSLTGGIDIIHPLDYGDFGKILVYQPRTRVDLTKEVETVPFAYDTVFDESSTNIQIYERSLRNLVAPFFEGQWATCFAYGQTGSG